VASAQRLLPLVQPADDLQLLHGRHSSNIALAMKADRWEELGAMPRAAALAKLEELGQEPDLYVSQAGFSGSRRTVSQASSLPCLFVDLDTYAVGITFDDPYKVLEAIEQAAPRLPPPNEIISSGRGWYARWLLAEPATGADLARWQMAEDALVSALGDIGADRNARDAARVLRIVGSINSKNGATVAGYARPAAKMYSLRELEAALAPYLAPAVTPGGPEPQELATASRPPRRRPLAESQRLRSPRLAQDRIHDLRRLAELRGGRLTEHRKRFMFALAVSLCWYCFTASDVARELDAFSDEFFADARLYRGRSISTALQRMVDAKRGRGKSGRCHGKVAEDPRYRLTNSRLIAMLGITHEEQRQLRTIISPAERSRRRAERRREAGMVEYQARTADRLERAVELRQKGLTLAAIGAELGVSKQAVHALLRRPAVN
jgi:hypothetical protein